MLKLWAPFVSQMQKDDIFVPAEALRSKAFSAILPWTVNEYCNKYQKSELSEESMEPLWNMKCIRGMKKFCKVVMVILN